MRLDKAIDEARNAVHLKGNLKKHFFSAILYSFVVLCAGAQTVAYEPVRTPQNVTVQRTLPAGILAPGVAVPAIFSRVPTDEEIFRVHFFEEPLVPANTEMSNEENTALVHALAAYSQRKSPDDFSMLTSFLAAYPKSRWRGALLANLGIVYRRTGYYNQAMQAWEEAWQLLKSQKEPKTKVLADRVIAELLSISSWTGRMKSIDSALAAIKDRELGGPGEDRVLAVKQGLWLMKNRPGISFKCGPFALNELYSLQDSLHRYHEKLNEVASTPSGFSLADLQKMAGEAGLRYQMAFRTPKAPVITNAVVHWKLDHYSALIAFENGQYGCRDATQGSMYGRDFWLTPTALDSSASGYFLVPAGPLPNGWRTVSEAEGSKIFGKGTDPATGDGGNGKCDPAAPSCEDCNKRQGMTKSNVHMASVSLHLFDRPLTYKPPYGPEMIFDVDYHQRDSRQTSNITYSNLGPKWTFEYLSFVMDNSANPSADATVYLMAGGTRTFTTYNATTKSYARDLSTNDVLVRVCANCYELRHADGSKEVYERPDGNTGSGRKIFLTRGVDPAGNELKLSYDANLRIMAIQDAIGQVTTLSYELPGDVYKITKVTDPFGRFARFTYDTQGRLSSITDVIGIVSGFRYSGTDFIDQLATPYGITGFIKTEDANGYNRSLETHYPMGEKERVEFRENAIGNNSEPVRPSGMNTDNSYLGYRNTFFWDKKAMQQFPGVYAKARIYHWVHGSAVTGESLSVSPILESSKAPLENRVWYNYQNQSDPTHAAANISAGPSVIGRVLDDGTTQLTRFTYNNVGKATSFTDPLNRKMSYSYDSTGINLLEVRQTTGTSNELVAKYEYNGQYLPTKATDASGMTTLMAYNAVGQLTQVTNAKRETTKLAYDANGYLQTITGPTGAVTRLTYDGFGRVQTVTDPEGYSVRTDYDNMNRPTLITYPDSTFEQIAYDRLDAVHVKDRLGRWSHTTYDSLDRADKITDALGRITKLGWCSCGSLTQITDPLNHVTTFAYDLQGRDSLKTYADGKTITYKYESTTSRLKEVTDAKGQKTQYSYFADGDIKQISYANAVVPTGSVAFTYDTKYNRIVSMKDTTGLTSYAYNSMQAIGGGLLATVDGPLTNDVIAYAYDSLNRRKGRTINGVPSSVEFDSLGRIVSNTNVLGNFGYNYVRRTNRLSSVSYPNSQTTVYDYYDNKGDQQLKQILNKASDGSTLSRFDYVYNAEHEITNWTQKAGATVSKTYELQYDAASQLVAASLKSQSPLASLSFYKYVYDSAGNRLLEHANNQVKGFQYNNLNQSIKQWDADTTRLVGGLPSSGSAINTIQYDANGNTVSTTMPAITYGWDAANRLVKIIQGANITEFIYDGLSRRVAEKLNGFIIKRWLWDGAKLIEERDSSGATITKRFFPQGEQINGVNYYFTFDHSGSSREITDAGGVLRARYSYELYGRRTRVLGSLDTDFGFAGYYYHQASNLYLTLFRAYDPNEGRWLSRDPIAEKGGINLYSYVANNPLSRVDFNGLSWLQSTWDLFNGFSDIVTLGLTDVERDLLNTNQTVNKCSGAYKAGEFVGAAVGLLYGVTELRLVLAGWRASKAAVELTASEIKSISSLQEQIAIHERKLAEYIANPEKYDNLGWLENAPSEEIRRKIIEGRIRHLLEEINTFKENIQKILNGQ